MRLWCGVCVLYRWWCVLSSDYVPHQRDVLERHLARTIQQQLVRCLSWTIWFLLFLSFVHPLFAQPVLWLLAFCQSFSWLR